ncbi:MAG: 50S ribosomal protein L17 [Bacteroidetes bacterium]|nr:50S ribosomal protein L17 [Bacteroidota bacterium]MCB9226887.1 50S ribosomal protein L17 [Chitinophagales bacterium]
MRHAKKINHLGRKTAHRNAMLSNMASSLIISKRIFTTLAKAKALRKFVEPVVTKSKENTTHNRRVVYSYLGSNAHGKQASKELFEVVAPKIGDRPGGYLRIIKTGFRPGDGAEMAMIEFVDFNTIYTQAKEDRKSKTRRSRRGGSKKAEATTTEAKKEEAPAKEAPEASAEETKSEE